MATLSPTEVQTLRQSMAGNSSTVHWTKAQFNAAMQAVEDRMQAASTKTAIASDIEAAAPGVFNAAEKSRLFAIWCLTAAQRLGVSP